MPRTFISNPNIIRFYWSQFDIRELLLVRDYCPYISVSGTYFIDVMSYPQKSNSYKTWHIREVLGNKYKINLSENKETYGQNIKFRYTITLPKEVYVPDIETVLVGRYQEDTKSWVFDAKNKETNIKEKSISFWAGDVGIYSLLVERNTYFPYKNWRLRCVEKYKAILNLETPFLRFTFEITPEYVKLIQNSNPSNFKILNPIEPELKHLVNREFKYDDLLFELRKCGMILYPASEDLEYMGIQLKVKNFLKVLRILKLKIGP